MSIESQPLSEVRWVHRTTLRANDYNPNHVAPVEMELLKTSILETGWTQPIVVLDDWTTIVDGFHRWTVSNDEEVGKLTDWHVPVVSCGLDMNHRVIATIRHNWARGNHIIDRMGEIVRDLRSNGLNDEEIQQRLGMEQEEIDRLVEVRGMPEVTGVGANRNKLPASAKKVEPGSFNKGWFPGDKTE